MVHSNSKPFPLGTCTDPSKLSPETHDLHHWDAQPQIAPVMHPNLGHCRPLGISPNYNLVQNVKPIENKT